MRLEMESITTANNGPQLAPTNAPAPRSDSSPHARAFNDHANELNAIIERLRESLSRETSRGQEAVLRINQLEGHVRMLESDKAAMAAKMANMQADQNKQIDEVLYCIAMYIILTLPGTA